MLTELENGRCGSIAVNTAIDLNKSLFTVHKVSNAYEGVKFSTNDFSLPRACGNDSLWAELLAELNKSNGSLDEVFEKNAIGGNVESDFYDHIAGNDYQNWIYFVYLKCKKDKLQSSYLRFVIDNTNRFEDFVGNLLNAIINIPSTDKRFPTFYRERKALVEKFLNQTSPTSS
jgi:hypothetical protein